MSNCESILGVRKRENSDIVWAREWENYLASRLTKFVFAIQVETRRERVLRGLLCVCVSESVGVCVREREREREREIERE